MKHILKPIEPPFSAEVAKVFEQYPQGEDGYIILLFRVFANSIRFLTKKGVLNLLDKDSPLTLREREIVILRATANKDCEYEWGVHVTAFSKAAKLTQEQITATRLGEDDAKCWTPKESLLVRCVDELCLHAKIQDDTYEQFQERTVPSEFVVRDETQADKNMAVKITRLSFAKPTVRLRMLESNDIVPPVHFLLFLLEKKPTDHFSQGSLSSNHSG